MKNYFYIIWVSLFTICPLWVRGQVVRGQVIDANKRPIDAACISLLKHPQKEFIGSDITDTLGNFKMKNLSKETVSLFVSAIGYQDTTLIIASSPNEVQLPPIILKQTTIQLDEVVIKAKSYSLRKKVDRLVMSITNNSELAKNNTVWGMLRYAPMVKVDEVQGLSILGKENVEIYINNRKSKLSQDEIQSYLKGLPAGSIKNIELITNPGSTFSTRSHTGIINITLRKSETEGIKGSASAQVWQTHYNKQIGFLNLNWVKGAWDVKSAFSARNIHDWSKSIREDYFTQTQYLINNSNTKENKRQIYFGNIDASYRINKKQEIGAVVDFNIMNANPNSYNIGDYLSIQNNRIDSILSSDIKGKNHSNRMAMNVNYKITLNRSSELRLDVDYQFYKFKQDFHYKTDLLNQSHTAIKSYESYSQHLPQTNHLWAGKAEYDLKLNDLHQLHAGMEAYKSDADNKTMYYYKDQPNHMNDQNSQQDNIYTYKEKSILGYLSYEAQWTERFSSMIGVRLEQTSTKGKMILPYDISTKHKYCKLLPSISVSFAPSQKHYLWYSLTDNYDFPAYTYLNPFKTYQSPTSYTTGNPDLRPSQTISQELGYFLNSKYLFSIAQYTTLDAVDIFSHPVGNSIQDETTVVNYGTESGVRLNININQSFFHNYWYLNASLSGKYAYYKSKMPNLHINRSSIYGEINLDNTVILSKKHSWQFMGNYQFRTSEKRLTIQSKSDMRASLELKKNFKTCALSLSGYRSWNYYDGKYHSKRSSEYITNDLIRKSRSQGDYQGVMMKFTYNFGNKKIKNGEKHSTTTSSQKNRFNEGY